MVHVRVLVPAMCLLGGCALVFPIIEDPGDANAFTDSASDASLDTISNDVKDDDAGMDANVVNLTLNGDFEQGASPCGPSWTADVSVTLFFAPGFDGGRACLVCSQNGGNGIRQVLNRPLDGGETFTFSAQVARADGGSNKGELIARFIYADSGMSPAYTSVLDDGGAWLYMHETVSPSLPGNFQSIAVVVAAQPGCIVVDDVQLIME